jgi:hypothetical protein
MLHIIEKQSYWNNPNTQASQLSNMWSAQQIKT